MVNFGTNLDTVFGFTSVGGTFELYCVLNVARHFGLNTLHPIITSDAVCLLPERYIGIITEISACLVKHGQMQ